jgi:hypothetical protein
MPVAIGQSLAESISKDLVNLLSGIRVSAGAQGVWLAGLPPIDADHPFHGGTDQRMDTSSGRLFHKLIMPRCCR